MGAPDPAVLNYEERHPVGPKADHAAEPRVSSDRPWVKRRRNQGSESDPTCSATMASGWP
jgi:hypothetical protein